MGGLRLLRAAGILAGLALAGLPVASPAAPAVTVSAVAKEFICNCGCNQMLSDCEMGCAEQLRGVIAARIQEGWDKPRIMEFLVRSYGEKLLAAPTKSGFNLTAWVTPFAALLVGGGVLCLVIGEWVARRRAEQRRRLQPTERLPAEYLARVDQELARLE